jgi:DNA-binding NtrC family response regulator
MKTQVLIIEDDPTMRLGMGHFLSSQGYTVSLCTDGGEGIDAIQNRQFDLIITDIRLPHFDGFEILNKVKTVSPRTGVILITGYAEIKGAVQAIKEGAFDYIAKPFPNEELLVTIEKFFKFQKLEDEVTYLREALREKTEFENIVGGSPVMKDVFDRIISVAEMDVPVLILGETGTGKELVANAIHRLSKRNGKPFIKINCAAIPETLFESELFGHEKGTFTGAIKAREGKFEFADGGSIFFDEIGDIPMSLQPKLLRVIEENTITRLGENIPIRVDVRTIYATRKNLRECIALGTFREDLFYRINVVPIVLPPLRENKEDIPRLIEHFLQYFKEKYNKADLSLSQSAYDALLSYNYPGNVRELKHAIKRAVVLSKNGVIDIRHLPDEISGITTTAPSVTEDLSLEESIRYFEKQRIIKALNESGGKKIEAAKRLGISRKVLWKKMKELDIE